MIRALHDFVVLKSAEASKTTPSGLHLPETAKDREPVGVFEVVGIGHDLDAVDVGFNVGARVFVAHEDVRKRGDLFFCLALDVIAVDDVDAAGSGVSA